MFVTCRLLTPTFQMLQELIKKVMVNAIDRYAQENQVESAQLLVYTRSEDATPAYKRCIQGKSPVEVTFKEILNVKIDLLNREAIAAPFMQKCLLNLANEIGCAPTDVRVYIFKRHDNTVGLHVYNKAVSYRPMQLSEVFADY